MNRCGYLPDESFVQTKRRRRKYAAIATHNHSRQTLNNSNPLDSNESGSITCSPQISITSGPWQDISVLSTAKTPPAAVDLVVPKRRTRRLVHNHHAMLLQLLLALVLWSGSVSAQTPTVSPSLSPNAAPTVSPTRSPSKQPTLSPTVSPTVSPTNSPSLQPSPQPTTAEPTVQPTTPRPSDRPSQSPSLSLVPSLQPSTSPSAIPSVQPSANPTVSKAPSQVPSVQPSFQPTNSPTLSLKPSATPSISIQPSSTPSTSVQPSSKPSATPTTSMQPSAMPSLEPSSLPSWVPSSLPSVVPTRTDSIKVQRSFRQPFLLAEERLNVTAQDLFEGLYNSYTDLFAPEAQRVITTCVIDDQDPFPCSANEDDCMVDENATSLPITDLFLTDVDFTCMWESVVANVTNFPVEFEDYVEVDKARVLLDMKALPIPVLRVFNMREFGVTDPEPSASPTTPAPVVPSATPSLQPSQGPSVAPTTANPTTSPTTSSAPTATFRPSQAPSVSLVPSASPSISPTQLPTVDVSHSPTIAPSMSPSVSAQPTLSMHPSVQPSSSFSPTSVPTLSLVPSAQPSSGPSLRTPSLKPSMGPSLVPTLLPSLKPSSSSTSKEEEPSSSAKGQESTIIIAVALAASMTFVAVFFVWIRRRRRKKSQDPYYMGENDPAVVGTFQAAPLGRGLPSGKRSMTKGLSVPDGMDAEAGGVAIISPSEASIVSKQSLISMGESGMGDESDLENDHTGDLQDEFDVFKDQNIEQLRRNVEEKVPGFEAIISEAVTRALMVDDYPLLDVSNELTWGCSTGATGTEIEASALCEANEWMKKRQERGPISLDQKQAFMQDVINRMVTSVRYGVLPAEDASRTIHESAALLGLQLAHQLPMTTIIISGMRKTSSSSHVMKVLRDFGDLDTVAVASGQRGFGIVRFRNPKSVDRLLRRYHNGEIVIQDVAVQMKVLTTNGQVQSRKK